MPVLYKRMKPQTLAYELFDIDKLDAGPRMIKECRQREEEQQEAEAQALQMQRRMEQMQPDYVLDLLNRSTSKAMDTPAATPATVKVSPVKRHSDFTPGMIALLISELGMVVFLIVSMVTIILSLA